MRHNFTPPLISSILLSICLVSLVPASLRFASTWRSSYFDVGDFKEQNLLVLLGFYSLGLEVVGLIVVWTGFRKRERRAWFLMLVILLFFSFPANVLKLLLDMQTSPSEWSSLIQGIRKGYWPSIWVAFGIIDFITMVFALLLPIKAFFRRPSAP